MNRTNVQRTIDYLRALPTHPELPDFNMTTWIYGQNGMVSLRDFLTRPGIAHECGTTACLAGHIVVGFRDEISKLETGGGYSDVAEEFLGLNEAQGTHLFYGHFRKRSQFLGDVTLDQAIAELERMLKEDMARA